MPDLTHVDANGNVRMVDVGEKAISLREAEVEGFVWLNSQAMSAFIERRASKGDVATVAQIAGIQAAKRTGDWIPLCHPIPLDHVTVEIHPEPEHHRLRCVAIVRTHGRTGVEMEAFVAVSAALMTIVDMLKAVDREMKIGEICLLKKTGGRSGDWYRQG